MNTSEKGRSHDEETIARPADGSGDDDQFAPHHRVGPRCGACRGHPGHRGRRRRPGQRRRPGLRGGFGLPVC